MHQPETTRASEYACPCHPCNELIYRGLPLSPPRVTGHRFGQASHPTARTSNLSPAFAFIHPSSFSFSRRIRAQFRQILVERGRRVMAVVFALVQEGEVFALAGPGELPQGLAQAAGVQVLVVLAAEEFVAVGVIL